MEEEEKHLTKREQPDEAEKPKPADSRMDIIMQTAGTLKLTEKQKEILYNPVNVDTEIEVRWDGQIWATAPACIRRLRDAFGAEWAQIPVRQPMQKGEFLIYGFHFFVKGKYVSTSWGAMEYQDNNPNMDYSDVMEGCETYCLRRNCKKLGMFVDTYNKGFAENWRETHAKFIKKWDNKKKYLRNTWVRNDYVLRVDMGESEIGANGEKIASLEDKKITEEQMQAVADTEPKDEKLKEDLKSEPKRLEETNEQKLLKERIKALLTSDGFMGTVEKDGKTIDLDDMAVRSLEMLDKIVYPLSDLQTIYNRASDLLKMAKTKKEKDPEVERTLGDDDTFKNIDPMA